MMSAAVSFQELVDVISSGEPVLGPSSIEGVLDAQAIPEPRFFVEPGLTVLPVEGPAAPGQAHVVIVSASAAVGKTVLSRELARRSGSSYWDLGTFRVGEHFLVGTVGAAFGYETTGSALASLATGRICLVLDGLDEALVRSTEGNFLQFLEDTTQLLRGSEKPSRPSIVMFARRETAEIAAAWLDELVVQRLEIAYFDRPQSDLFVERCLASRNPPPPGSPQKQAEVRDRLFERISTVFGGADPWAGEEARTFAGYAPVLNALAERVVAELQDGRDESVIETPPGGDQTVWAFLTEVCDEILVREQQKFLSAVADLLPGGEAAFSPAEQLDLLVADRPGSLPGAVPDSVPADRHNEYQDRLRTQLLDHPFWSRSACEALAASNESSPALQERFVNQVFRDRVLAHGIATGAKADVDRIVHASSPTRMAATEMLAYFVWLSASDGRGVPAVPLRALPPIYESLLAGCEPGWRIEFADGAIGLDCIVRGHADRAIDLDDDPDEFAVLRLAMISEFDDPLVFRKRVAQTVIETQRSVVLGEPAQTVRVGEDVDITSALLVVRAAEVALYGRVNILAEGIEQDGTPQLQSSERRAAAATITVPDAPYPWQSLAHHASTHETPDRAADCIKLYKVLKWFRGGIGKGLMYPKRPLDIAIARGKTPGEMLEYLLERGVVIEDGKLYRLDPDAMGFSHDDVIQRKISAELGEFLDGFARFNAAVEK